MASLPHQNKKDIEFKGMFYNNSPQHHFYEGGAHFDYKELVNILTTLSISLSKEQDLSTVNENNDIILYHKQKPNKKISNIKCLPKNTISLKESKRQQKALNIQIFSPRQNALSKDFSLPKMPIPHNSTKIPKKIFVSKDKNSKGIRLQNEKKYRYKYNGNENESLRQILNSSSLAAAIMNKNAYASNILVPIQLNNNNSPCMKERKKNLATRNSYKKYDRDNYNSYRSFNDAILKPIKRKLNASTIIPKNDNNEQDNAKQKILLQLGLGDSRNYNNNDFNNRLKKSNSLLMHNSTTYQKNTPHHINPIRSKQ